MAERKHTRKAQKQQRQHSSFSRVVSLLTRQDTDRPRPIDTYTLTHATNLLARLAVVAAAKIVSELVHNHRPERAPRDASDTYIHVCRYIHITYTCTTGPMPPALSRMPRHDFAGIKVRSQAAY
jgi:hypothetical protein